MLEAIGWECQQALEKRGRVRVAVSARECGHIKLVESSQGAYSSVTGRGGEKGWGMYDAMS